MHTIGKIQISMLQLQKIQIPMLIIGNIGIFIAYIRKKCNLNDSTLRQSNINANNFEKNFI